jgi:hypothetical protein
VYRLGSGRLTRAVLSDPRHEDKLLALALLVVCERHPDVREAGPVVLKQLAQLVHPPRAGLREHELVATVGLRARDHRDEYSKER